MVLPSTQSHSVDRRKLISPCKTKPKDNVRIKQSVVDMSSDAPVSVFCHSCATDCSLLDYPTSIHVDTRST